MNHECALVAHHLFYLSEFGLLSKSQLASTAIYNNSIWYSWIYVEWMLSVLTMTQNTFIESDSSNVDYVSRPSDTETEVKLFKLRISFSHLMLYWSICLRRGQGVVIHNSNMSTIEIYNSKIVYKTSVISHLWLRLLLIYANSFYLFWTHNTNWNKNPSQQCESSRQIWQKTQSDFARFEMIWCDCRHALRTHD